MKGVGVLALGRAMEGPTAAKHRIKRVWRFFRNPGVECLDVSKALFESLAPSQGRIVILCDWTDLSPFQQLVFSLPRDGRSLPFLSLTIYKQAGEHAMVNTERKALGYLAGICPQGREVVFVADRGFGNTRWIRDVRKWGWGFVQRVSGNLHVDVEECCAAVADLAVVKGAAVKDWGEGLLTDENPTLVRIVSVWEQHAKEPWVLVTDRSDFPAEIVRIYKRRMWIEGTFRDLKNRNWGLGLDATRLSQPHRHDRLFIVLAVGYAILTAFGAAAETLGVDQMLKANTENTRVMTLARIGGYFLQLAQCSIDFALQALLKLPP
jgi:hypothetical protein